MLRLSLGEKGVPANLEQSVGEKGKSVALERCWEEEQDVGEKCSGVVEK